MLTTQNEQNYLLSFLDKNTDILEYGSGESTLLLQQHVKSITSMEHDIVWFDKILSQIEYNCTLLYCPPNNPQWESQYNNLGQKNTKGDDGDFEDFMDYVLFPISLNKKFDVVFIDGRARVACAYFAQKLLKPNGSIFIHDFGIKCKHPFLGYRTYYNQVDRFLTILEHVDTLFRFKSR